MSIPWIIPKKDRKVGKTSELNTVKKEGELAIQHLNTPVIDLFTRWEKLSSTGLSPVRKEK